MVSPAVSPGGGTNAPIDRRRATRHWCPRRIVADEIAIGRFAPGYRVALAPAGGTKRGDDLDPVGGSLRPEVRAHVGSLSVTRLANRKPAERALCGMPRLPRALTLRARECEEPNAYHNPDNASIELCYNLLPAIAEDLLTAGIAEERLEEAVTHVFSFFLLHELGHALIDILDLAVPGRQEDMADQLSVYALVEDGDEDGVLAALDGAAWFGIRSHRTDAASAFWDSHSLDAQRYYNINCWVYGSSPEALAHVPEDSGLPLSRSVDCPRDYQNLKRFWDRVLEKFRVQPRR